MGTFVQLTINGLTVGSFYALVALGYTIVYGIIRLINFAQGDLSVVGMFLGWTLLTQLSVRFLPLPLAILLVFLITALGASLVLSNTIRWIYGPAIEAYPDIVPLTGFSLGPAHVSYMQVTLFGASVLLMLALFAFVQGTPVGTAMRALAVDHDAARLMGVNVDAIIRLAFVLGGILAGASGVMLGIYYAQIHFSNGFLLGLRAFTAAVIGGIGNIPGAMAGGMLIGLLEAYTAGYISSKWQDVVVFGVLIAVLVVRPMGLFGERVAERM